jgi:DNA polymerase III epsilon subunit-like protein
MREIVMDTETTGLDPLGGHRIVEIGAVEEIDRSSFANLEPITQQRDPALPDPRAVWLDITLSIVELESATILMKRAWWP